MGPLLRSCAEVREPIELSFGVMSGIGSVIHVLDGGARGEGVDCGGLASSFTPLVLTACFCTLHPNSKSANILKAAVRRVTFGRRFSYSKVAQHLMHSTEGCTTSRRVSIIQARAFFAMRVATRSSQMTLGRTCLCLL